MPPRDPSKVQLDFPQLNADLIDQLNLVGQLGLLDLIPEVRPIFIIGSREGALALTAEPPAYTSAQVFSGSLLTPAPSQIAADTGQLPVGTYDLFVQMQIKGGSLATSQFACEHRDAGNAFTLANLLELPQSGGADAEVQVSTPPFGYVIAANERIRCRVIGGGVGRWSAQIFARIRPVP